MKGDQLKKHIYATYVTLRRGLIAIAVALPALLYVGGRIMGIPPQSSMSAYYHASAQPGDEPQMRVWFVGLLFAIGVCLILYKGFSTKEDILLNLAGIFAILVALFPMPWNCQGDCPSVTFHGIFAVLLFVCVGIVSLTCFKETLHLLKDGERRRSYARWYRIIGGFMVATPLTAFVFTLVLDERAKFIFFIEAVGIWVFAYYWMTKSREMAESHAELRALQGEI